MAEEFEKLEGAGIWLPDKEEDVLQGEVTKISEGLYGLQHTVKSEAGEFRTPSHKVLQARLQEVKVGDYIKIVYKGSIPPKVRGQNPTEMYEAFRRK